MLGDRKSWESGALFHYFDVDSLIPADHILRRIDSVLDTSWIRDEVADCYSKLGRPSVDPEVVLRMILLGYLFGLSEKRLCDELAMHMGYRWFCRLQPSDKIPDRTTLVKLRNDKWKQDIWIKLLDRTVTACIEAGLVSGHHVSIDGTQIHADASIHSLEPIEPPTSIREHLLEVAGWGKSVPREQSRSEDDDTDDTDDVKPGAGDAQDFHGKKLSNDEVRSKTDPDARLFRKSYGVGATLSYLGHLCMDTRSRVWLAVRATPAHTSAEWTAAVEMLDRVKARLGDTLKIVAADKGYGVRRMLGALWQRGLKAHIPVQGKPQERNVPRLAEARRRVARLKVFKRQVEKRHQEIGRNAALRAHKTRTYGISRRLRLRIEHAFGEGKTCHGLARARCRGGQAPSPA